MAGMNDDLIGDQTEPTEDLDEAGASSDNPGMHNAIHRAISGDQIDETEEAVVKKQAKAYQEARDFDKGAREQYAKDRKYAAGTSDNRWASDANLTGSFIDILVSFLYAQNPDVGCRAAAQVGMQPNKQNTDFAQTTELVVSKLWKTADLKRVARKQVRSSLSVGPGWMKAVMWSAKRPQPQVEQQMHDLEDQLARIKAMQVTLASGESPIDPKVQEAEILESMKGVEAKLEAAKRYGMNIDFCRAEDIQVSLDVADISEYKDADWVSQDLYVRYDSLTSRFPDKINDELVKKATCYYQRNTSGKSDQDTATMYNEDAQQTFTRDTPRGQMGGSDPVKFAKVIELWDRKDNIVKTWVEGINKWAVDPYAPTCATERFYPFFQLAFFLVDGQRHPQSLSYRMSKLQDEFNSCRSSQRIARERSIPGIVFHAGLIGPDEAKKLAAAVSQELIPLNLTGGATVPLANIVSQKPIGNYDPRIYDTTPILQDMERISGVQEALQQAAASSQPKTATEANIQQTGFASRTGADRDQLETMLGDFAVYTTECAIQICDPDWVKRVCGPAAYWPYGMDTQDLLTLVEIDITAGTTGKPTAQMDKASWSQLLPLIEKSIIQIRQLQHTDQPLAQALTNVLQESLRRVDDRFDLESIIPTGTPTPLPAPPPPKPHTTVTLKGDVPEGDIQPLLAGAPLDPVQPGIQQPPPGAALAALAGGAPGGAPPAVPGAPPPGP